MEYRTVRERAEDFFLEKRSRFIGSIAPAQTEEEALRFLAEIRSEHPQARHHVYAYLLRERNTTRFSDAGEPSGTGGAPVLGVLQKEGLTDVVLVVTRYFGGTLLGAGGLTRAYAHAAKLAVDKASIRVMRLCASVRVSCPYALYDRLAAALSDAAVCAAVAESERQLEGAGRVLVRESGTEPLIRVMAEAPEQAACDEAVDRVVCAIREKGYEV